MRSRRGSRTLPAGHPCPRAVRLTAARPWPPSAYGGRRADADAGAVSYSATRSCVSETAPRRSASLASRDAAVVVGRRDAELVEQVGEVLLDRGLGDHEFLGDRPRGRGLGEHVAREQRTAERDEHVALARRQVGRRLLGLGRRAGRRSADRGRSSRVWPIRISSPCRNRREAQIRSPLTHVPFDEPRSVTHQPGGKALEHRVQMARGGVVGDRDVVLGAPCRRSSGPPRARRRSLRTPEITSICGATPPSL